MTRTLRLEQSRNHTLPLLDRSEKSGPNFILYNSSSLMVMMFPYIGG